MQTLTRLLIPVLVCSMALSATAAEKYALLIAVAKYDHAEMNKPAPLEFPEEDAKALGKLLESGGYKVELLLGKAATQSAIKSKLTALQNKADAEGVVLIGLFGHGIEVDTVDASGEVIKDGCFCPYDTTMREALDFKGRPVPGTNKKNLIEPDPDTLIKLGDLMRTLKLAKAGNRIVLADCCRTTPNAARGRSFGANFSVQDLPDNTSLLFGCSPNEKAFEHKDWGHGAFTKCLLDSIGELSAQGGVDTAQLASQMKKRVPALVASVSPSDRQTPKPFITDVVDLQLELSKPANSDLIVNSIGMKLKLIPAGELHMGSNHPEAEDDEKPMHRVQITKPFYAGIHEVTLGQTLKWLNSSDIRIEDNWITGGGNNCAVRKSGDLWERNSSSSFGQFDDQPMQNISWLGASAFCEWCSQQNPEFTYRLPTEAEWEYIAKAGSNSEFPWGNEITEENANVLGTNAQTTKPVGSYPPNKLGIYDTAGNVLEWCLDTYSEKIYKKRAALTQVSDPFQIDKSTRNHVLRGGSWFGDASLSRSAKRADEPENYKNSDTGFRVICIYAKQQN